MKTIHLKAPFLKLLREKKSNYCIQLTKEVDEGEDIVVADSRRKIKARVKKVYCFPVMATPWLILDQLEMNSHNQFAGMLKNIYPTIEASHVYILELAVQSS